MNRTNASPVYHRNGVLSEPKPTSLNDTVELSEHARLIGQLRELPEVRTELIERARAAINNPGYLSEDRLNTAIERLIEDINLDDDLAQ